MRIQIKCVGGSPSCLRSRGPALRVRAIRVRCAPRAARPSARRPSSVDRANCRGPGSNIAASPRPRDARRAARAPTSCPRKLCGRDRGDRCPRASCRASSCRIRIPQQCQRLPLNVQFKPYTVSACTALVLHPKILSTENSTRQVFHTENRHAAHAPVRRP